MVMKVCGICSGKQQGAAADFAGRCVPIMSRSGTRQAAGSRAVQFPANAITVPIP